MSSDNNCCRSLDIEIFSQEKTCSTTLISILLLLHVIAKRLNGAIVRVGSDSDIFNNPVFGSVLSTQITANQKIELTSSSLFRTILWCMSLLIILSKILFALFHEDPLFRNQSFPRKLVITALDGVDSSCIICYSKQITKLTRGTSESSRSEQKLSIDSTCCLYTMP